MGKNTIKLLGFAKQQVKLIAGVSVGIIIGGSALAIAAVPDANGVIHACVKNDGGQVRVAESCDNDEAATSWDKATPGKFVENLVGADFSTTSLAYRNFAGVDMHSSILVDTVLNGADFNHANLSGVLMSTQGPRIPARKVNFTHTNLTNGQIVGSFDFANSNFTDVDFSNSTWGGGDIINADFKNSNNIDFTNVSFGGASFTDSDFDGLDFQGIAVNSTAFITSNLANTDFSDLTLSGTTITQSTATNANFTNVQFIDASLQYSDFSTVDLTGATWTNTVCPDATNSDNNGDTCIGHLVP